MNGDHSCVSVWLIAMNPLPIAMSSAVFPTCDEQKREWEMNQSMPTFPNHTQPLTHTHIMHTHARMRRWTHTRIHVHRERETHIHKRQHTQTHIEHTTYIHTISHTHSNTTINYPIAKEFVRAFQPRRCDSMDGEMQHRETLCETHTIILNNVQEIHTCIRTNLLISPS